MAWCPDWYALIQDAKYLGVDPWELLKQGLVWRIWAQKGMNAEKQAKDILNQH